MKLRFEVEEIGGTVFWGTTNEHFSIVPLLINWLRNAITSK